MPDLGSGRTRLRVDGLRASCRGSPTSRLVSVIVIAATGIARRSTIARPSKRVGNRLSASRSYLSFLLLRCCCSPFFSGVERVDRDAKPWTHSALNAGQCDRSVSPIPARRSRSQRRARVGEPGTPSPAAATRRHSGEPIQHQQQPDQGADHTDGSHGGASRRNRQARGEVGTACPAAPGRSAPPPRRSDHTGHRRARDEVRASETVETHGDQPRSEQREAQLTSRRSPVRTRSPGTRHHARGRTRRSESWRSRIEVTGIAQRHDRRGDEREHRHCCAGSCPCTRVTAAFAISVREEQNSRCVFAFAITEPRRITHLVSGAQTLSSLSPVVAVAEVCLGTRRRRGPGSGRRVRERRPGTVMAVERDRAPVDHCGFRCTAGRQVRAQRTPRACRVGRASVAGDQ